MVNVGCRNVSDDKVDDIFQLNLLRYYTTKIYKLETDLMYDISIEISTCTIPYININTRIYIRIIHRETDRRIHTWIRNDKR